MHVDSQNHDVNCIETMKNVKETGTYMMKSLQRIFQQENLKSVLKQETKKTYDDNENS